MRAKRVVPGNPKVAIGYLRASKDEQKLSCEVQQASIEAWCRRENVTVVAWYKDEGISSVTPLEEREGLGEAFAGLKANRAGLFMVAKRDRLSREPMLTALLEIEVARLGAKVKSAADEGNGDSPVDEMLRGMLDVFAKFERAMIRFRTKGALAVKAKKGHRVGDVPYGFRSVDGPLRERKGKMVPLKLLEPIAIEQEVINKIWELHANGERLCAIQKELCLLDIVTRDGKPFASNQIARIIDRMPKSLDQAAE